jgi:hypothetical protein
LLHYVVARARHRTSGESNFCNSACNFTFVRVQIPKPQSDWCSARYLVRSKDNDDTCRRLFSSSSDDNDFTYVPPLNDSSADSSDASPFVDKPPKVPQSAGVRAAGLSFPEDVSSSGAKPRTTAFGQTRSTDRRDCEDVKRRKALKTCPVDGCGQAKADISQQLRHCHRHLTASERKQLLLTVPRAVAVLLRNRKKPRSRNRRRRPFQAAGVK